MLLDRYEDEYNGTEGNLTYNGSMCDGRTGVIRKVSSRTWENTAGTCLAVLSPGPGGLDLDLWAINVQQALLRHKAN